MFPIDGFPDEEVDEIDVPPVTKSKKEIEKETMEDLRGDFKKNFRNYVSHSTTID